MSEQFAGRGLADVHAAIQSSVKQNRLWPSVHDAIDTYMKRRAGGAAPYELIWRLIHVWEATYITSAMVAVAAVRSGHNDSPQWLSVREELWGLRFDHIENDMAQQEAGAMAGKMDKWLRILQHAEQLAAPKSRFLLQLQRALRYKTVDVSRFLTQWGRVCATPAIPAPRECRMIDFISLMNSFRNRLAHVPFPHQPIVELAAEIESLTIEAWSAGKDADGGEIPEATNPGKGGWLCGGFARPGTLVRGAQYEGDGQDGVEFVFQFGAGRENIERFDARPFIHFDDMHNPHVFTRLLDEEDGLIEYTRFQAEAQPIAEAVAAALHEVLPKPKRSDYPSGSAVVVAVPIVDRPDATEDAVTEVGTRSSADPVPPVAPSQPPSGLGPMEGARWYMKNEQFDEAIEIYQGVVSEDPSYHVAWARMGIALRERAARRQRTEVAEALEDIERSLDCLNEAAHHISPDYQAEVKFNRSKSLFRKWVLTNRQDFAVLKQSVDAAEEAAKQINADYIIDWCDRVTRMYREAAE
jgi:hypothetical protein